MNHLEVSKELRERYWIGCQRGITTPDSGELNLVLLSPVTEFIFNLYNQIKRVKTNEGGIVAQYIQLGARKEQAIFFAKNHSKLLNYLRPLIDQ